MGKNQNTRSHRTKIIFREIKIIFHPSEASWIFPADLVHQDIFLFGFYYFTSFHIHIHFAYIINVWSIQIIGVAYRTLSHNLFCSILFYTILTLFILFKSHLVKKGRKMSWHRIGYVKGDDVTPFGILWPFEPVKSHIRNGKKHYRVVTNPVKPFVINDGQ
jgi:hypothetical protein